MREKTFPKGNGKVRSLGIPTVVDRVVQASLKLVLEPIFEADFKPCSYGFCPRRRAQDAIAEIHFFGSATRNYLWVFEADIEACFDQIDHTVLMGRVRDRIGDKRVTGLVKAFLRAGVLGEDSKAREAITGIPQGGILSPLLANIALSVLDEHFTQKWEALGPDWARARHRRAGNPTMRIVRYADDFVVMVAGTRGDAEALRGEVSDMLAPMGLGLSEAKSKVCHIDEGFDFLGWRIQRRARRGQNNKRAVYTYTSKKALASVMAKVRSLTARAKHRTLGDLLISVNRVLRGWFNYFRHGVSAKTFSYLDHSHGGGSSVGYGNDMPGSIKGRWSAATCPIGRYATATSRCSGHNRSLSSDTDTGAPESQHHGQAKQQDRPPQRHNTWRAGCDESRSSGSENGPQKPTSRNADRALRSDFYSQFEACVSSKYAYGIIDLVTRKWIATTLTAEPTSLAARVLFTKALDAEGLLTGELAGRLSDLDAELPSDDESVPLLLAISDNGTEMRAGDTRKFMAAASIAQHFGRPGTPTDQAWIETLWGHLKREHPHLLTITDPAVLAAELERLRVHYNDVRLHEAIGYVTPNDEHEGRGDHIRQARRAGLIRADQQRRATRQNTP